MYDSKSRFSTIEKRLFVFLVHEGSKSNCLVKESENPSINELKLI